MLKRIDFINERQILQKNWKKAEELTHDIDLKDLNFVALTIQSDAVLWTGDKSLHKGLKKKGFNHVVNLEELKRLIREKE